MCGNHHHHRRGQDRELERVAQREDRSLRVSDRERDEVATLLRDHAAEGRLNTEELDDRVERALAARTGGDLDAVLADLPARRTETERARGRAAARQGFLSHATTWAAVSILLVV